MDLVVSAFHPSGSTIKVALYGASLYSFVTADGEERLFLSEKTLRDGTKPIRGGIPLVFTQFGAGPLTNHGFARTTMWTVSKKPQLVDGEWMELSLTLTDTADTLAAWAHSFELTYTIKFSSDTLTTSLDIHNTGVTAYAFQALLHTYFKIEEITECVFDGFLNVDHIDQLQNGEVIPGSDKGEVRIVDEVDRIYKDFPPGHCPLTIGSKKGRIVSLEISLMEDGHRVPHDVVLWNPWVDKSKRMVDFGDDEYHNMVCVEPGCVSSFRTCEPDAVWKLSQKIQFFQ